MTFSFNCVTIKTEIIGKENKIIYEKVKSYKTEYKQHPLFSEFYDLSITKVAKELGYSTLHIDHVIRGKRKASEELNQKLNNLINKVREERKEYYKDMKIAQ